LNFTLDLLGRVVGRGKRDSGSSSLGNGESEENVGGEIGRFVASASKSNSILQFLTLVKGQGRERGSNSRKLVTLDKVMLDTLFDSHSCASLIFHNSEGEGEGSSLGGDFREGCSGSLHLEHVGSRGLGEDGGLLNVGGFGLKERAFGLVTRSRQV